MRFIHFVAIILTALAVVPGGAHLAEMPAKMVLDRDAYFQVQQIYAGWALFGIVLIGALAVNLVLALLLWWRGRPFIYTLAAALLLAANLAIFFTWTFPANQATQNWTSLPDNWAALRLQWESSHAANAVLAFAALIFSVIAGLRQSRS